MAGSNGRIVKPRASKTNMAHILPNFYFILFVVISPILIFGSMIVAMINPNDYYYSLAPVNSEGLFFQPSNRPGAKPPTADEAWNSPQITAMLYQFMGAFASAAVIEGLILYCARFKMRNAKDAELAIWCVEMALLVFDFGISLATIFVVGPKAVIPGYPWSEIDEGACVNTYLPLVWAALRLAWFSGLGREFAKDKTE